MKLFESGVSSTLDREEPYLESGIVLTEIKAAEGLREYRSSLLSNMCRTYRLIFLLNWLVLDDVGTSLRVGFVTSSKTLCCIRVKIFTDGIIQYQCTPHT